MHIARQFGMDGSSGSTEPARDHFEICYHCSNHLSTVQVGAFHVNAMGEPTNEVAIGKYRVITCMSATCISRARQRLSLKLDAKRVWMGNPFETRALIAENSVRRIATTSTSKSTGPTNLPQIRRN